MENSPIGSGCNDLFLTRHALYNIMRTCGKRSIDEKLHFLSDYIRSLTKCPENLYPSINKKISYFASDFKKKWIQSNRKEARFLENNKEWLLTSIGFPTYVTVNKRKTGRPEICFENATERTKRQKTKDLRTMHTTEELSYAAQMSLRASGQSDAAKILKDITTTSPKRATRYRTAYKQASSLQAKKLSSSHALSLFVDANLTREQYNKIRTKDPFVFPSYKEIQKAKKDCYPDLIFVTETSAEVQLQSLLDHTAKRIVQLQEDVIRSQKELRNIYLVSKWGFDESNQPEYKQSFLNIQECFDANIFITSLVPLLLKAIDENNETIIIWQNKRFSSTRFCRPIRFQFARETSDLAKKEKLYITNQIEQLKKTICSTANVNLEISHELLFTMVDGKICNSLTETASTQCCYICGLTSKNFNNLQKVVTAKVDEDNFSFGLSILHAKIRFLECILHIAYKLPIKTWQARGKNNKKVVEDRKKNIQNTFKTEMGLIVDKPRQGLGNTNDGNTARRVFNNPEKASAITGVNLQLIKRFKCILETLACGHYIDISKFKEYTWDTAKLYTELYGWYAMPTTVHKILVHGPDVITKFFLPIGQLSEEAQEANNKVFKKYRECFSRKISCQTTNRDVLNRLLIGSDPLISSMCQPSTKKKQLDKDVLELLLPLNPSKSSEESMESSSQESDDSDTE